jgi:two-component system OmpR family sensor kinase
MLSSLNSRLWLTYVLLVAVVLCVVTFGLLAYLLRNPLADRQAYLSLERAAVNLLNRPEALAILQQRPALGVQQVDNTAGFRALVFSAQGEVLADSRGESGSVFGPLALRILKLPRGVVRDREGQSWLHVTRPLPGGGFLLLAAPRTGGLNLLLSGQLREVMREDILPSLVQAGALALLTALLLAFWMTRWISGPLQHVSAAAREAARGKYQRLPPEGPVEVQELVQAFNYMTERVQAGQQAQRDFVANVSHELKTPLTSIQGFAQAILDGAVEKPEDLRQAAGVIHDEAGRMHRLVLDLLDLARLDAGAADIQRVPLNLGLLLGGIVDKFQFSARQADIRLELQVEELPGLQADPDRLAQVFTNLLDNALKYTPSGGSISVVLARQGDLAVAQVRDSGPGIPEAELSRVFERFYQTDKSRRSGRRGVGLGLPIAREIILAHGGSLSVENISPQGCVFMVKLPLARPDETLVAQRNK